MRSQDLVDTSQYLELYPAAFAPLAGGFDMPAIQELYSSVDFIGMSSYTSLTPDFPINDIEGATYQFDKEIASFGVDLKDLIFNKARPAPQRDACMCVSPAAGGAPAARPAPTAAVPEPAAGHAECGWPASQQGSHSRIWRKRALSRSPRAGQAPDLAGVRRGRRHQPERSGQGQHGRRDSRVPLLRRLRPVHAGE